LATTPERATVRQVTRPPEPLPGLAPDLAAAVLALAGIRNGQLVLDLTPAARLTASAAAAAGPQGRIVVLQPTTRALPPGATRAATTPAGSVEGGERLARVLAVAPQRTARELAAVLGACMPHLAGGARIAVLTKASSGRVGEGLPAVLAELGLEVLHAEGMQTPAGRLAIAVARPLLSRDAVSADAGVPPVR